MDNEISEIICTQINNSICICLLNGAVMWEAHESCFCGALQCVIFISNIIILKTFATNYATMTFLWKKNMKQERV